MRNLCRWLAVPVLAALLAAPMMAQSVVSPNANWTTNGGLSLNSLHRQFTRTVQQAIAVSELGGLPLGAEIVGISLRASTTTSNPASWPATPASWANYEITLAQAAVPITAFTTTFASNMLNPVQVRSGPYTMPVGSYPNNGTPGPNPFDTLYFAFQKPYVYQGGDLVVLVTHDGNNTATAIFTDCVASSPTTYGFTSYATTYQATTATVASTSHPVMRLHYGVGPAGIAGSGGISPRLVLSNNLTSPTPVPGSMNLAVVNATGSSGLLVVATGILPGPLGLPNGANLLVAPPFPAILPITFDANGRFDLNVTLPANVSGRFGAQVAVYDGGAPGGFVSTNAVLFQFGP